MGAFLLYHKLLAVSPGFDKKLSISREIFEQKLKLPFSGEFSLGDFTFLLYGKKYYDSKNFISLENGDFVASTGGLFYKGNFGKKALFTLYNDYLAGEKIENNCKGQYFVVLKSTGNLVVFRDYYGLYPVYHNSNHTVFSSSFLVSAHWPDKLTVAKSELYEYIINGFWFGNQTLFKEIKLLSEKGFLDLASLKAKKFNPDPPKFLSSEYKHVLSGVVQNLIDHFGFISSAFSNLKTGLSGGYDSRMMLAGLLYHKKIPTLYVNGTPGSVDSVCAKKIAQSLSFPISMVRFYECYDVPYHGRKSFFENRFYHFDGLGTSGIFDNYSDIEYVLKNPSQNHALLNGGGGEIFRESWNLPNRSFSVDAFIRARFEKEISDAIFIDYSKKQYLNNVKEKVLLSLGKDVKTLQREDVELLNPSFRHKSIHFILSTKQLLYPFIKPFSEVFLIDQSLQIPMKYKYNAHLVKDVIDELHPGLAGFMSSYGYSFSQKVPLKIALKEWLITNTPLTARPILRNFKKNRKLPVKAFGKDLLDPELTRTIMPEKIKYINEFLNAGSISNDAVLSRALTVELLFDKLF